MRKILKITSIIVVAMVATVLLLAMLITLPSVQHWVTSRAQSILQKQYGIATSINTISIGFPTNVLVEGLNVYDDQKDTLLHVDKIDINARLAGLLIGRAGWDNIRISGLDARLYRIRGDSAYNFTPLLALFASESTDETAGSTWTIDPGNITLEDWSLRFVDASKEIDWQVEWREFTVSMRSLDLDDRSVSIRRVQLDGLEGDMRGPMPGGGDLQASPSMSAPEPATTASWKVDVDRILLRESAYALDIPAEISLDMDMGIGDLSLLQLNTEPLSANLEDLRVERFNSKIGLYGNRTEAAPDDRHDNQQGPAGVPETIPPFGTTPIDVDLQHISIANSNIQVDLDTSQRRQMGLDPDHLLVRGIHLEADQIHYTPDSIALRLAALSLSEQSGVSIQQMRGEFAVSGGKATARNVLLSTQNSTLQADALLSYPDFSSITSDELNMQIGVHQTILHGNDLTPLAPDLSTRPVLRPTASILIDSLMVSGSLLRTTIQACHIRIGSGSMLHAAGWIMPMSEGIEGIPQADLRLDTLTVLAEDVRDMLADSTILGAVRLPDSTAAHAQFRCSKDSLDFQMKVISDAGQLQGAIRALNSDDLVSWSGDVSTIMLRPGTVYSLPMIDSITAGMTFSASTSENLVQDARLHVWVDSISVAKNTMRSIEAEVQYDDPTGVLALHIDDSVLSAGMKANFAYSDEGWSGDGELSVKQANLEPLTGYSLIYPRLNTTMQFEVAIDSSGSSLDMQSQEFRFAQNAQSKDIHPLKLHYRARGTSTDLDFLSSILEVRFSANRPLDSLTTLLRHNLLQHFTEGSTVEYHDPDAQFRFELALIRPDVLSQLISEQLHVLQIEQIEASYVGADDLLWANVDIPGIHYSDYQLDDMTMNLRSEPPGINSEISMESFSWDTIRLRPVRLQAITEKQVLRTQFTASDTAGAPTHRVEIRIETDSASASIAVEPRTLIIGSNEWKADPRNKITVSDTSLTCQNWSLSHGDESIRLDMHDGNLVFDVQRVGMGPLLSIIEYPNVGQIAKGLISGQVHGKLREHQWMGSLDFNIADISISEHELGDIQISAEKDSSTDIHFAMRMIQDQNRLHITGSRDRGTTTIMLEPYIYDFSSLQYFLPTPLDSLSGSITGGVKMRSSNGEYTADGALDLHNLALSMLPYNKLVTIPHGQIVFVNRKLQLSEFTILDAEQNPLALDGYVDVQDRDQIALNIDARTSRFAWLSSPEETDSEVRGTFYAGLDFQARGSLQNPSVTTEIEVQEGTDVTYILPGETLEINSDKGIVYFSKHTKSEEELMGEQSAFIGDSLAGTMGMDLAARLKVSDKARFTILTNPTSGDYTTFSLRGSALYKYNDTQRGQITGVFETGEGGYYELSFYGLVKKRFNFRSGSSVTWSNSVMDGQLNFVAEHEVRTNSIALFSDQISEVEQSRYNQRLPYKVILEVQGTLARPDIQFAIDLPERYKASNPSIASKLQSLNQPDAEAERNRQVFGLLVAGTFIPSPSGSNAPGNDFATTAARNSINAMLTQQLNNLSDQVIKGIDVDLGLNTYDYYSSGAAGSRTQMDIKVSKKLFDERVIVEVESNIDLEDSNPNVGRENTSGVPEFAVIYQLTKDGRYRVKAFKENAYDIYDGEIQNAGIAFIFLKEIELGQKKAYKEDEQD